VLGFLVSFTRDTPELAHAYSRSSSPQFSHGRLLLDSLSLQSGESVLDLGAGTGELARLAADRVGESGSVLALEPLPDRVTLARSQPRPNLIYQLGGSDNLTALPSSAFDVVLLNSVFHWIADQQRLLHDLSRLLKPGGRLGLSTGITERPHQQVALLAPLLAKASGGRAGLLSPPHVARRDVLHQQLEAAGYVDVAIEEQTFLDHFADLAAVLEWNESSFFGNFLQGSSPSQNPELWAEMERTLERLRQPAGIELERYLFLVRATKR
jgi:arsenite methyltransferase